MVASNYTYFFKYITDMNRALILNNDKIEISINNQVVDLNSFSGGQKTVISICLIFAIQKTDPSPFYVFDEIDANLDLNYSLKIYDLIRQSDAQFLITSFKNEAISCGDKFFGVVVQDQCSHVGEIDKDLAVETLRSAIE
eukprot:GHVR01157788.1.p2 GENE.GHVR01157788.1~~GHVR01157788.1.p2  ORF type:complete len:140 (+),score=11.15 GHVR01157788.1:68-487(+)